jgi:hypothetical protein
VSHLIEYPLSGGGVIRVQAADTSDGAADAGLASGPATRGRLRDTGTQVLQQTQEAFEDTLATIRPAADALLNTLTDLHQAPDEIGVEFGVQLSAQAGAVIATLGTAANFKITLTWRRPDTAGQ